jgi:hypothetical protein
MKSLEGKSLMLSELDEAILAMVSEEEIESEIEQTDIVQESIQSVIIQIQMTLEKYERPAPPVVNVNAEHKLTTPTSSPLPASEGSPITKSSSNPDDINTQIEPSNPTVNTSTSSTTPTVKLPKLNLKKFRGDPTSWTTFWDTFESSIHKNPNLSSIDKFNYLSSLLEGAAADSVAGLTLTNANYEEALKILKKRFGNKQLVINKHMDILLNLQAVTSIYNLKGLRTLYDTVESHIRALTSLGVQPESYGNLLCSMLLNKLLQELCVLVSREVQGEVWNLEQLLRLVERELEARERATANTNRDTRQPSQIRNATKQPPSIAALHTGGTPPTCTYCQQSHTSNSCTVVSNVTARIDILRKTGRCFLCLRKNHLSRDCSSRSRCYKCNGNHHISICTKKNTDNKPRQSLCDPISELKSQQQSQKQEGKLPNVAGNKLSQQSDNETRTLFVNSKTPVLLQTAQATILPVENNGKGAVVRVILDSGSQRSYISHRVRDLLGLSTVNTESLLIKTFGLEEEKLTTCDTVKFILKSHLD